MIKFRQRCQTVGLVYLVLYEKDFSYTRRISASKTPKWPQARLHVGSLERMAREEGLLCPG